MKKIVIIFLIISFISFSSAYLYLPPEYEFEIGLDEPESFEFSDYDITFPEVLDGDSVISAGNASSFTFKINNAYDSTRTFNADFFLLDGKDIVIEDFGRKSYLIPVNGSIEDTFTFNVGGSLIPGVYTILINVSVSELYEDEFAPYPNYYNFYVGNSLKVHDFVSLKICETPFCEEGNSVFFVNQSHVYVNVLGLTSGSELGGEVLLSNGSVYELQFDSSGIAGIPLVCDGEYRGEVYLGGEGFEISTMPFEFQAYCSEGCSGYCAEKTFVEEDYLEGRIGIGEFMRNISERMVYESQSENVGFFDGILGFVLSLGNRANVVRQIYYQDDNYIEGTLFIRGNKNVMGISEILPEGSRIIDYSFSEPNDYEFFDEENNVWVIGDNSVYPEISNTLNYKAVVGNSGILSGNYNYFEGDSLKSEVIFKDWFANVSVEEGINFDDVFSSTFGDFSEIETLPEEVVEGEEFIEGFYYSFDNLGQYVNSSNIVRDEWGDKDALLFNASANVLSEGVRGNAAYMNSSVGNYLIVSRNAYSYFDNEYTLSMWIRLNEKRENYLIYGESNEIKSEILLDGEGFLNVRYNGELIGRLETSANDFDWHYFVLTRNMTKCVLYFDNESVLEFESDGFMNNLDDVRIGFGESNFEGFVDEVSLINEVFSSEDVNEHYQLNSQSQISKYLVPKDYIVRFGFDEPFLGLTGKGYLFETGVERNSLNLNDANIVLLNDTFGIAGSYLTSEEEGFTISTWAKINLEEGVNSGGTIYSEEYDIPATLADSGLSVTNDWCDGADIDENGVVNADDYTLIIGNYNRVDCNLDNSWCYCPGNSCEIIELDLGAGKIHSGTHGPDFDQNGVVNADDLTIISVNMNKVGCSVVSGMVKTENSGGFKLRYSSTFIDEECADADVNGDLYVDGADVGTVASYQDTMCINLDTNQINEECADADVNGDLYVDGADVGTVASYQDKNCYIEGANAISYNFYDSINYCEVKGSVQGVQAGKWHNILFVSDGEMIQIYVDGTVKHSKTFDCEIGSYEAKKAYVGKNYGKADIEEYEWSDKFRGSLDEFYIYDRALSLNEIDKIYASGKSVLTGSVIGEIGNVGWIGIFLVIVGVIGVIVYFVFRRKGIEYFKNKKIKAKVK